MIYYIRVQFKGRCSKCFPPVYLELSFPCPFHAGHASLFQFPDTTTLALQDHINQAHPPDASPLLFLIWLFPSFLLDLSFYVTPSESLPVLQTWVHPAVCLKAPCTWLFLSLFPLEIPCWSIFHKKQWGLDLINHCIPSTEPGAWWTCAEWTTRCCFVWRILASWRGRLLIS